MSDPRYSVWEPGYATCDCCSRKVWEKSEGNLPMEIDLNSKMRVCDECRNEYEASLDGLTCNWEQITDLKYE